MSATPDPALERLLPDATDAPTVDDIEDLFANDTGQRRAVLRLGNRSLLAIVLAVTAAALTVFVPFMPLETGFSVCIPVCAIAAVVTGAMMFRSKTSAMRIDVAWQTCVLVFGVIGGVVITFYGGLISMFMLLGGRGRQIRSFGRPLLPPVVAGDAWTRSDVTLGSCAQLDEPTRRALARQWRENGRTEHASVAAFAELTRELMILGAPPALLASAQHDALDEIRHTELCFAVARALDGAEEGPGPLKAAGRDRPGHLGSRTLALSSLAVSSLIDGVLHEGLSARILARLARRCQDIAVAAVVKTIAADEGRHAAHGWDVVRWCVAEGGVPVVQALRGAAKMLAERAASPQPDEAKEGGWERHGINGDALHHEEYAKALADVRRRVANLWTLSAPASAPDPARDGSRHEREGHLRKHPHRADAVVQLLLDP